MTRGGVAGFLVGGAPFVPRIGVLVGFRASPACLARVPFAARTGGKFCFIATLAGIGRGPVL